MVEENIEAPTGENPEIPESVALANAVNDATRGPRFGIFEQVLCTHIYMAANSPDPLKKIQHVADAALMLEPEKQKSLKIDVEKVSVIKTACTALTHAIKTNVRHYLRPLVSVKFGFEPTEENYKKYVEPWDKINLNYYAEKMSSHIGITYRVFFCASCQNEVANDKDGSTQTVNTATRWGSSPTCGYCGADLTLDSFRPYPFHIGYRITKYENVSDAEFRLGIFNALSEDGYVSAINSFLQWTDAFILETMRKVTEAVRPEIFNEVAKLYAVQHDGERKNEH